MELTAVIRALESLKRECAVAIYTDSQYVKNGIQTWIHAWKKNGWKTADRKPVKNAELWRELDALAAKHRVRVALGQGPQRPSGQRSRRRARQSRRRAGSTFAAAMRFARFAIDPAHRIDDLPVGAADLALHRRRTASLPTRADRRSAAGTPAAGLANVKISSFAARGPVDRLLGEPVRRLALARRRGDVIDAVRRATRDAGIRSPASCPA